MGSDLRERGIEVLAFNPTGEAGYTKRDDFGCAAAEWETHDADEFIDEVETRLEKEPGKHRVLIIDEAHDFFSRAGAQERNWIGTRGRHFGLTIIAITQKATLINTTFRGQCAHVYIFRCSLTDAKFIADEYGSQEHKNAVDLPPGSWVKISSDGKVTRGQVFS